MKRLIWRGIFLQFLVVIVPEMNGAVTQLFSNCLLYVGNIRPIRIAARSKARILFARSNAGIVGSNPTQGMEISALSFCVCVVLCVGTGFATGSSPVQGVLPNVYRFKKVKKREP
jgi:hypothetical protein